MTFVPSARNQAIYDFLLERFESLTGCENAGDVLSYSDPDFLQACDNLRPDVPAKYGGTYELVLEVRNRIMRTHDVVIKPLVVADVKRLDVTGLYRLRDAEIAGRVKTERLSAIRGHCHRGQQELRCADTGSLTPRQRDECVATLRVMGLVDYMARPSLAKRIETDVISVAPDAGNHQLIQWLADHTF